MSDTLNVLIQTCPVCNGQGRVSMPPWIPGDVPTWSASGIETYDCRACGGTGLIRRDVPTAPGRAAVVEPPREGPTDDIAELRAEWSAAPTVSRREWLERFAGEVPRLCDEITRLRSALSAAQQDSERVREDAEQMRYAGAQLANLACNLAQRDGPLSQHQRDSLRACQTRWDSVVVSHCAAVSPSPEPRT